MRGCVRAHQLRSFPCGGARERGLRLRGRRLAARERLRVRLGAARRRAAHEHGEQAEPLARQVPRRGALSEASVGLGRACHACSLTDLMRARWLLWRNIPWRLRLRFPLLTCTVWRGRSRVENNRRRPTSPTHPPKWTSPCAAHMPPSPRQNRRITALRHHVASPHRHRTASPHHTVTSPSPPPLHRQVRRAAHADGDEPDLPRRGGGLAPRLLQGARGAAQRAKLSAAHSGVWSSAVRRLALLVTAGRAV
jgi:hypothetical protein